MTTKNGFATILVAVVFALAVTPSGRADSYLFSATWRYVTLDNAFKTSADSDLREKILPTVRSGELKFILETTQIYKVYSPISANRIYMLLGRGKENRFYGVLVVQNKPVKLLHFIALEMTMEFPVGIYEHDNTLYLTYGKVEKPSGNTGKYEPQTVAYNVVKDFELTKTYTNKHFFVNDITCGIDGELYNGRMFNPTTGDEVQRSGIPLGVYVYDCQDGNVLGMVSKSVAEPAQLLVANLGVQPITRRVITTDERIIGFNTDEWRLTPNAAYIIRDEQSRQGRTGKLVFIDVAKNVANEIRIPSDLSMSSGILGFSPDGRYLLYASDKKIHVVELASRSVKQVVPLSFSAIGIVFN